MNAAQFIWQRGAKRVFDALFSSAALILLAPALLILAALTQAAGRGPVFFSQDRIGRHGRPFRLRKFRTMPAGRTPDPLELVPLEHPELNPAGRFMRRFKLDELPQLFNVLLGDMAIVGPRPTLPDQVERYDPFQRRRLEVRPGLTGLAQVNGNAAIPWPERIRYDVAYVDRCGPALDLVILARTVAVIVAGEARFARPFDRSPYASMSESP